MNSDFLEELRRDIESWRSRKKSPQEKFPDELRSRIFGLRELFDDRLLRRELSLSPGFFKFKESKRQPPSHLRRRDLVADNSGPFIKFSPDLTAEAPRVVLRLPDLTIEIHR
jgi:hypothetical protein